MRGVRRWCPVRVSVDVHVRVEDLDARVVGPQERWIAGADHDGPDIVEAFRADLSRSGDVVVPHHPVLRVPWGLAYWRKSAQVSGQNMGVIASAGGRPPNSRRRALSGPCTSVASPGSPWRWERESSSRVWSRAVRPTRRTGAFARCGPRVRLASSRGSPPEEAQGQGLLRALGLRQVRKAPRARGGVQMSPIIPWTAG